VFKSSVIQQEGYTGWLKLKCPSSKFAISWQSFRILPWNLQHR